MIQSPMHPDRLRFSCNTGDLSRTAFVIAGTTPATAVCHRGPERGTDCDLENRSAMGKAEQLIATARSAQIPVFRLPEADLKPWRPSEEVTCSFAPDLNRHLCARRIAKVVVVDTCSHPGTLPLISQLLDLCYDVALVNMARSERDVNTVDTHLGGVLAYLEVSDRVWCPDEVIDFIRLHCLFAST
ncbi:hypothetical protein ACW9UR_16745 [Halovulum sp. GXIMD14794]